MKRAFISDVHGNLSALEATLEDIRAQKADFIAFLGDAVGYGPKPNECVERIAEVASVELMGNHDYAAIGSLSIDEFNGFAREAMLVTRAALTESTLARIAGYRLVHIDSPYHMVHSSPDEPLAWNYVVGVREAIPQFEHFATPFCVVAHSHRPLIVIARSSGSFSTPEDGKIKLVDEYRYLINVGSVGQPRDGNPDASYLLLDEEEKIAEIRRVAYPVEDTQSAMEQMNMPAFLIERLAAGK